MVVIVHIVTIIKTSATVLAASLVNILTGNPQNLVEQVLADALRELVSTLVKRSRLMNPEVP